jgi:hypothetical protein
VHPCLGQCQEGGSGGYTGKGLLDEVRRGQCFAAKGEENSTGQQWRHMASESRVAPSSAIVIMSIMVKMVNPFGATQPATWDEINYDVGITGTPCTYCSGSRRSRWQSTCKAWLPEKI